MTILPFRTETGIRGSVGKAARHVQGGGLIAYPTETVYGFGCALAAQPLARLARLKRRNPERPFLLLVDDASRLPGLRWTDEASRLAAEFWPGPLTLLLESTAPLPPEVCAPDGTVAVRISSHLGVLTLLRTIGAPITSTSANAPGRPPATDADSAVEAICACDDPHGWYVLDGGALPASPPSTIVRCSNGSVTVIRAGAIPAERLRAVVGEIHV